VYKRQVLSSICMHNETNMLQNLCKQIVSCNRFVSTDSFIIYLYVQ